MLSVCAAYFSVTILLHGRFRDLFSSQGLPVLIRDFEWPFRRMLRKLLFGMQLTFTAPAVKKNTQFFWLENK